MLTTDEGGVCAVPDGAAPTVLEAEPDGSGTDLAQEGRTGHWSQHDHWRHRRCHSRHSGRGHSRVSSRSRGRCYSLPWNIDGPESSQGATQHWGRRLRSGSPPGGGACVDEAARRGRAVAAATSADDSSSAGTASAMPGLSEPQVRTLPSSVPHLRGGLSAAQVWTRSARRGNTGTAEWRSSLIQPGASWDSSTTSGGTG